MYRNSTFHFHSWLCFLSLLHLCVTVTSNVINASLYSPVGNNAKKIPPRLACLSKIYPVQFFVSNLYPLHGIRLLCYSVISWTFIPIWVSLSFSFWGFFKFGKTLDAPFFSVQWGSLGRSLMKIFWLEFEIEFHLRFLFSNSSIFLGQFFFIKSLLF